MLSTFKKTDSLKMKPKVLFTLWNLDPGL